MTNRSTDKADRKIRASVYLEAARIGAEGSHDGACIWLMFAQNKHADGHFCDPYGAAFSALFKPEYGVYWGEQWAENLNDPRKCPETRNCRVIALCLMAAMVEAGDA